MVLAQGLQSEYSWACYFVHSTIVSNEQDGFLQPLCRDARPLALEHQQHRVKLSQVYLRVALCRLGVRRTVF